MTPRIYSPEEVASPEALPPQRVNGSFVRVLPVQAGENLSDVRIKHPPTQRDMTLIGNTSGPASQWQFGSRPSWPSLRTAASRAFQRLDMESAALTAHPEGAGKKSIAHRPTIGSVGRRDASQRSEGELSLDRGDAVQAECWIPELDLLEFRMPPIAPVQQE